MHLSIDKNTLDEGVQTVARCVSPKSPLPILSHILAEASGETLRLTATDLDMGITLAVPCRTLYEGARALPARLLLEIVNKLPAAEVALECDEAKVKIRCARSKFEVASLPPEEFPSLPAPANAPELAFPQREFRAMVKKVATACAASDESRAVMTGILVQVEGDTLRMVATDGRRLAVAEHTLPEEVRLTQALGGGGVAKTVIVPGRAMGELARIAADSDDPLRLRLAENQLFCTARNVSLHCRLLEGHFPEFQRVMPREFQRTLRVGREALLAGLKRMLIVAQERQSPNLIVLACEEGRVEMSANTPDLGLGTEEIPVIYEGAPLRIAFNGKYMQDVLSVLDDEEVQVDLQDDTRSAVLHALGDTSFKYVLMPVRLREAEAVAA